MTVSAISSSLHPTYSVLSTSNPSYSTSLPLPASTIDLNIPYQVTDTNSVMGLYYPGLTTHEDSNNQSITPWILPYDFVPILLLIALGLYLFLAVSIRSQSNHILNSRLWPSIMKLNRYIHKRCLIYNLSMGNYFETFNYSKSGYLWHHNECW